MYEGYRLPDVRFADLSPEIQERFQKCRFIVTDFDGVWTNNSVLVNYQDSTEAVMHSQVDGFGVYLLYLGGLYDFDDFHSMNHQVDFLILTMASGQVVRAVAEKVHVKCVLRRLNKVETFLEAIRERGLEASQAVYVGNDVNDIDCMEAAGIAIAVADSYPLILKYADFITQKNGGDGAVREVCDMILYSKAKHPYLPRG